MLVPIAQLSAVTLLLGGQGQPGCAMRIAHTVACCPEILVQDSRLAYALCTMPKDVDILSAVRHGAHICVYEDKMSSSGVWLGPLVGHGFKPWRGLIQLVQTIVLTLVDLTPICNEAWDKIYSMQEPSL